MYVTSDEKQILVENLVRKFLDNEKGNEVFFVKELNKLYTTFDEFTADSIVRLFKRKITQHIKNNPTN